MDQISFTWRYKSVSRSTARKKIIIKRGGTKSIKLWHYYYLLNLIGDHVLVIRDSLHSEDRSEVIPNVLVLHN